MGHEGMKTEENSQGATLCESCGLAVTAHPAGCEAAEVLYWSIRGLLSRANIDRLDSDVVASLTLGVVGEWLRDYEYSIVTPSLEIVEVG
jgi:hypothetical protein